MKYRPLQQQQYQQTDLATNQPYNQLFIYYLQGRLSSERDIQHANYIGNWEEDDYSFIFFSQPSRAKVSRLIKKQPHLLFLDEYCIPFDQWHGQRLATTQIGGFTIQPPWGPNQSADRHQRILLDPGVVFGAGTHPTTRDCLEAIEIVCGQTNIESTLDLGTGSGLLAIAASKRTGCRCMAVDLNLLAAKTAANNVRLNYLENKILSVRGRAEDFIEYSADLVIANIHYEVMRHLIVSEGFLAKRWFILSGLLRSEAKCIGEQLDALPVQTVKTWQRDGIWHTFCGMIT